MRRALILLAEIALLIVILRLSFVQDVLTHAQQRVSSWIGYVDALPEQRALSQLRDNIDTLYVTLRPYQQHYLDEMLSSRHHVQHFYTTYCHSDDKNPFLFGASRAFMCTEIEKSDLLENKA